VAKNDGNDNKEGEGNGKIEFVVVSSTQCFRHVDGHKNHLEGIYGKFLITFYKFLPRVCHFIGHI